MIVRWPYRLLCTVLAALLVLAPCKAIFAASGEAQAAAVEPDAGWRAPDGCKSKCNGPIAVADLRSRDVLPPPERSGHNAVNSLDFAGLGAPVVASLSQPLRPPDAQYANRSLLHHVCRLLI